MTAGKIVALFRPDVKGQPPVALQVAEIVTNRGIAGDRHGKPDSRRQVLLMDVALSERWGLQPGELDENLTVDGLAIDDLQPGQQLRIGSVLLEITIPCPVCDKLDSIRAGLRGALRGQRGMFTRVLSGGTVRIGDTVTVQVAARAMHATSPQE